MAAGSDLWGEDVEPAARRYLDSRLDIEIPAGDLLASLIDVLPCSLDSELGEARVCAVGTDGNLGACADD